MIEIIGTALHQWDTGRSVKVTDIEVDHVHFANKGDSKAVIMDIADSQVKVPDYLFQTGKQLCVYAVRNGITVESRVFFVTKRERPENYVYEEDQRNYIYELLADMEAAAEDAKTSAASAALAAEQAVHITASANEAAENANNSADSASLAAKNANEAATKAEHTAKALMVVGEAEGVSIALDDAIDQFFVGMRIFGKTTQDGVPTPEAPTDLVSVENPTLTVNDQTLLIPYTLHGIPVNFGGHYTDASGQRWICDEISLHSAKRIARIKKAVLSADVSWNIGTDIHQTQNTTLFYCTIDKKKGNDNFVCDRFQVRSVVTANNDFRGICGNPDYPLIYVRVDGVLSLNEFREWIAENPITILYEVNEPVETPLSAEEIAAYSKLRTYKESTTVSNDASAYMKIQYVMDAKKYIDSQISAGILAATVE
jgi:hypothetical protein